MDFADLFSPGVLGQGGRQMLELGLAFVLSSLIGLERELRLKSAGLRTHALVGLGAALMMLVSKYGFSEVIVLDHVSLDPSRVAAQIVSGIGFLGAGLIFVRKDIVHGLTTAATIWVTAGIGMACSGGLPLLAIAATGGHFIVAFVYTTLMRLILGKSNRLVIRYRVGQEVSAKVLSICTAHGFVVRSFSMKTDYDEPSVAVMVVRLLGTKSLAFLAEKLSTLPEIISVNANTTQEEE